MSGGMIHVSSEKLEHARISLAGIPGGAQRAVKSALHRVADGLKTDAVKETKQRYHLLPGEIRRHLLLKKAAGANQSVSLIATGRRKPISEYKAQGRGKSLRVAVRTTGLKTLRTGFVSDKNGRKTVMYLPQGQGRPAMPVISPSVPQAIANKETRSIMEKQAHERFEKRLDHEILRLLGAFK
jgi:hypothetical protein